MINLTFKDVGQGDSIWIEWSINGLLHVGIIDCNISKENNPILQELIEKDIKRIEFIIITHLHYDHYSGFASLFEYCILKKVVIAKLYHTFETEYFRLFANILLTQKQWKTTEFFLDGFKKLLEEKLVEDIDRITINLNPIKITDQVELSFLSPIGIDYIEFSDVSARFHKKIVTTAPDFNNLATIISIDDKTHSLLLTSDAPKKAFKRIKQKAFLPVQLIQAPHHGSTRNLEESFWIKIDRGNQCLSVFSIGEVKKDKLPNKNVVEFFDLNGYYNHSTNYVYGIAEYYGNTSFKRNSTSIALSAFTKKRNIPNFKLNSRFIGDQLFPLF